MVERKVEALGVRGSIPLPCTNVGDGHPESKPGSTPVPKGFDSLGTV